MITKNILKILPVFILLLTEISGVCASVIQPVTDTTATQKSPNPNSANWSFSGAFHSASLYFFTGTVDQSHPSFDALFIYDRKTWGGFAFKSLDLIDHKTGVNYAMAGIHKIFNIGQAWSVMPTIGINLNQNYTMADKGSDFIFDMAISYKINPHFTVSNDALFQNIGITKDYNWTNRLKLSYHQTDFYLSALVWERNRAFHNPGYLSAGLDAGYNIIKLSHKSNLFIGISNIYMLQSDIPRRNGFMFNLGLNLGS